MPSTRTDNSIGLKIGPSDSLASSDAVCGWPRLSHSSSSSFKAWTLLRPSSIRSLPASGKTNIDHHWATSVHVSLISNKLDFATWCMWCPSDAVCHDLALVVHEQSDISEQSLPKLASTYSKSRPRFCTKQNSRNATDTDNECLCELVQGEKNWCWQATHTGLTWTRVPRLTLSAHLLAATLTFLRLIFLQASPVRSWLLKLLSSQWPPRQRLLLPPWLPLTTWVWQELLQWQMWPLSLTNCAESEQTGTDTDFGLGRRQLESSTPGRRKSATRHHRESKKKQIKITGASWWDSLTLTDYWQWQTDLLQDGKATQHAWVHRMFHAISRMQQSLDHAQLLILSGTGWKIWAAVSKWIFCSEKHKTSTRSWRMTGFIWLPSATHWHLNHHTGCQRCAGVMSSTKPCQSLSFSLIQSWPSSDWSQSAKRCLCTDRVAACLAPRPRKTNGCTGRISVWVWPLLMVRWAVAPCRRCDTGMVMLYLDLSLSGNPWPTALESNVSLATSFALSEVCFWLLADPEACVHSWPLDGKPWSCRWNFARLPRSGFFPACKNTWARSSNNSSFSGPPIHNIFASLSLKRCTVRADGMNSECIACNNEPMRSQLLLAPFANALCASTSTACQQWWSFGWPGIGQTKPLSVKIDCSINFSSKHLSAPQM